MREPLATFLALAALAVFAGWAWLGGEPEPGAAAGRDGPAEVAVPVAPEVPNTPVQGTPTARFESAEGRGSIRGRIVDSGLAPIAGARAQVVHDDRTEGLPFAQTDGDGRFLVTGVPLTVCALRAEAPGMAPVQLGDLHPENLPTHDVDAGTIVLSQAMSYHGQVRSRGRGVADARVVLAPVLGPPGRPVPVVQVTRSDEDGHFHFPVGPQPDCFVRVEAEGHRAAPTLRVTDARQALQFELVPLARARGRVVDKITGAPVAGARIWAFAMAAFAETALLPRPDLEPESGTLVDKDGSFDVALPDAARACLQVEAPGCCSLLHGPIEATRDLDGLVLALEPAAALQGTVSFRGEPVAARASLRPVDAPEGPAAVHLVGADGVLRVSQVASGSWILRVDADVGARFEQRIEVRAPAAVAIDVVVPEGTRLAGTARTLRSATTTVVCTHESGLQRRALVRSDGGYEVEGMFPGRWRAHLEQGDSLVDRMGALLADLLPDAEFELGTELLHRRDLASNDQRLGRITGSADLQWAGMRVALVPVSELQQRVPVPLRNTRVGADGTFAFDPLLPGNWRIVLGSESEPVRTLTLDVRAGIATQCTFVP